MRTTAYSLAIYAMALSTSLVAAAPFPHSHDVYVPCIGDCVNKVVENNKPDVPAGVPSTPGGSSISKPSGGSTASAFDPLTGLPRLPKPDIKTLVIPGVSEPEVPASLPNLDVPAGLPKPEVPKPELPAGLPKPEIPAGLPNPEVPAGLPKPEVPAGLPKPEVPASPPTPRVPADLPKPDVPAGLPKPEVPAGLPKPDVPGLPKPEVPADLPKPDLPAGLPKPEVPAGLPKPEVPAGLPKPEVPYTEGTAKDIKDKVDGTDLSVEHESDEESDDESSDESDDEEDEYEATVLPLELEAEADKDSLDVKKAKQGGLPDSDGVDAPNVEVGAGSGHDD